MKIVDEREMQKTKNRKQRQKRAGGTEAVVKWSGLNDFVVHLI